MAKGSKKGGACAMCGDPVQAEYAPFCSRRCADVDLNRWLGGVYRVQTEEEPDPGEPIPVDLESNT